MKQNYIFKRTLFALVLLMASTLSWAYDFEAKNADGVTIYYRLINDGTEAEVTYSIDEWKASYFDEVITIPETVAYNGKTLSVTSIGNNAFYDCSSLTSINIPESVTNIDFYAFGYCIGLISVDIPKSMTSIGSTVFYNCYGLTSVTIPESVTSIGDDAFYVCSGLTSVYSLIENPFSISSRVFYGIAYDATLYVPQGTKSAYESAGWTRYFSNVVEFNTMGIADTPAGRAEGNVVYGLNGTKVNVKGGDLKSLPRGIYVRNGKKTIVK